MDADQFETIVARYYEPLFRFALSLTRTEADACDLTQHVFYVWATKGHQLRDQSKAKAWLFTTLHRAFLATRRTHSRFTHNALEDVPIDDLPVYAPDFVNAVDSPQVLAALAKVDAVYQAALALFYLEDWSYPEIAQILQIPLGTVKSRIARGIMQLRQIVKCPQTKRSTATVPRTIKPKAPGCATGQLS
jgi:RNA polymerase sigma-70 factor (ECF subfamily)